MSRRSNTDILTCNTGQLRTLLELAVQQPTEYGTLLAHARRIDEVQRLLAEAQGLPHDEIRTIERIGRRDTSLADLRQIRDLAKGLIARAETDSHREAAILVYHAASAAALGRHGINLSSVPPQSRLPFYEDLASALATHPLADVFREAVDSIVAPRGA